MQRVKRCVDLLVNGTYKHEIKRQLKVEYGVSTGTVERYLHRARTILVTELEKDRSFARGESLSFYRKILEDPMADPELKLKARERIDKLLGLNEPTLVHQHVSGGTHDKLTVEYVNDDWSKERFDISVGNENNQ